jgi:hypothetical protein
MEKITQKYRETQIEKAENKHDWDYKMTIQFKGTSFNSNNLSITEEEFKQIKAILTKTHIKGL